VNSLEIFNVAVAIRMIGITRKDLAKSGYKTTEYEVQKIFKSKSSTVMATQLNPNIEIR
jgi:hypothetical protein